MARWMSAHGDVGDRDVLQMAPSTVSSAKPRQPSNTQLEMVMFLKPPLDSVPHLMRPVPTRPLGSAGQRFQRAVEHRAEFVDAGDVAVGDRDVFGRARIAEREGALGADAVVPGRIDGAVGDAHVAAAVDIHAVAVGVDVEIVDGEVVDAGREDAEPSSLKHREVAQEDVVAVLQRDRFVADAGSSRYRAELSRSCPRLRPLPQMRPGPKMAMSWRFSPQMRLLCQ